MQDESLLVRLFLSAKTNRRILADVLKQSQWSFYLLAIERRRPLELPQIRS